MLKMPEEMTPEELAKFEQWMDEADAMITKRKDEQRWRCEDEAESLARSLASKELGI